MAQENEYVLILHRLELSMKDVFKDSPDYQIFILVCHFGQLIFFNHWYPLNWQDLKAGETIQPKRFPKKHHV